MADADEDEKVSEAQRKMKIVALQKQAADRAKIIHENQEKRREVMDVQQKMKHEAKVVRENLLLEFFEGLLICCNSSCYCCSKLVL